MEFGAYDHGDVVKAVSDLAEVVQAGQVGLRDYFAAKAMTVLFDKNLPFQNIASLSYQMADAMIEARTQEVYEADRHY